MSEDSQLAKQWPRWRPSSHHDEQPDRTLAQVPSELAPPVPSETISTASPVGSEVPGSSVHAPIVASATPATAVASSSTPKAKPKSGPRKSKTLLPNLPSGKPKKLTTLEKSAMDWRTHLSEQDGTAVDELERNRRAGGGGYLEKVEFMDRVEGRREEIFEKEKGAKRRRV